MPHRDGFTVEDWLALPESKQRVELIDGCYVVSPFAATSHQLCTGRLARILDDARPEDLEVTEGANVPCVDEGAIPDVVVGDTAIMVAATVALDPRHIHLVAEVVSPGRSNRRRDYTDKPRMYAAAGIPTFLRVELTGDGAPCVEVLVLKGGEYVQAQRVCAGRALRLSEPFEVSFDPARLAGPRRAGV
ncbi:Uma2 family endonuclease [Actinomadura rubrisoli]|uniref:Uma2 family endonuclease n=1 Tax=Actinomadura rubrisoli TaxID=2530368 RepID=A0A4R5A7T7_9ACTN|nr:Uma2 family endonuclease [Actinomadura rubrisoli]TDD67715.1 Uma2 family endonuclease [Actinomadura rubrisoli]